MAARLLYSWAQCLAMVLRVRAGRRRRLMMLEFTNAFKLDTLPLSLIVCPIQNRLRISTPLARVRTKWHITVCCSIGLVTKPTLTHMAVTILAWAKRVVSTLNSAGGMDWRQSVSLPRPTSSRGQ